MAVRGSRGVRKKNPNTDTRNASAPAGSTRNVELEDESKRNQATFENEEQTLQQLQPDQAQSAPAQTEATADEQARRPNPEHVAVAAYYLAERRGFTGDQQIEDWLAAERSLAAEHAGAGDNEAAARGAVQEDIQPDQVERWAQTLNVSPERLRVAIQRVGPVSSEVRKFLQDPGGR